MERDILFVGTRTIFSKKKDKDLYLVDYIDIQNIPQTDFVSKEEYDRIKQKGRPLVKQKGIFQINSFNKIYLSDIKA